MPKLSDAMEEGKILKWLVAEGDEVSSGDVIAEIETDKADMEMEAFEDGVLVKIVKGEGEQAAVGEVIAYIGEAGEKVAAPEAEKAPAKKEPEPEPEAKEPEASPEPAKKAKKEKKADEPKPEPEPKPKPKPAPRAAGAPVKASPIARRLADAAGVAIADISGSGPDGRVVKRDVEAHLGGELPELEPAGPQPAPTAKPAPAEAPVKAEPAPKLAGTRVALSSMRKTIGKRLSESKFSIPHYYVTVEVDMGPVAEARELIAEQEGVKISPNDFVVKACAKALMEFPQVNAGLEGEEIVYHQSADIGVAVALDEGLITPVVRDCQSKTLLQISEEIGELAARARERKLQPEEYTGNSFAISNLGMFGVDSFTAIINPPASAILAIGQMAEVPVVVDGEVKAGLRVASCYGDFKRGPFKYGGEQIWVLRGDK